MRRGRDAWLLVGTHAPTATVVVAPTSMLDGIADRLLGASR